MYLIPKPNGEFIIRHEAVGQVQGAQVSLDDPALSDLTQVLLDRLAPLGGLKVPLTLEKASFSRAEEYILAADKAGVTLRYGDRAGANNGLVTLYQLLCQADPDPLPCLFVHDWPRCTRRGQSFDSSRHFFTVEEMKHVIEQLALLKCNTLHWVCVNDQAWRIQIDAYPALTEYCKEECYSKEEVRDLIAFARARAMEIVPEFEMPGHESAALSAYPELTCRGNKITPPTVGGIFPALFCAGKQETYDFIKTVLTELLALFPSKEIHLGGDEAPKGEWKACPACQQKIREQGLKNEEELQAHLMNYAADIVKKAGRTPLCWNECLRGGQENLDADFVVQYWMDSGYCKEAARKGRPFILSNFRPLYLDYPCSMSSLEDVYTYEPHIRGVETIPESQIYGYESCIWAEHIADIPRLEYMLFPRVLASMEVAWSRNRDYEDFRKRAEKYVTWLQKQGIQTRTLEEAEIRGAEKAKDLLRYAGYMIKYAKLMKAAVSKEKEEIRTP